MESGSNGEGRCCEQINTVDLGAEPVCRLVKSACQNVAQILWHDANISATFSFVDTARDTFNFLVEWALFNGDSDALASSDQHVH